MLDISAGLAETSAKILALPVCPSAPDSDGPSDDVHATLVATDTVLPDPLVSEINSYLADVRHSGAAGTVYLLPRPGRDPTHIMLVGVGSDDNLEAGWRSAGAAVARKAASRLASVTVLLPRSTAPAAARSFAEGAWLASYRYRLSAEPDDRATTLRRMTLAARDTGSVETAIASARAISDAVILARDLTNAPSVQKSPKWFADRVANAAARRKGVTTTVHDENDLAEGRFGAILAVGAGSSRPPRMVELSWRPRRSRAHVVLVGKGITFDSGGISIKTAEQMKLMRKDMGGAAAVCAAVLGAADLELPVRVTALAPLAENMISGSSMRPGDVVRHYGGLTTEVQNTDGEGRLVLGDALAYAARRLKPDLLVDLATLTGASHVALGKRTAALFTHNDAMAVALAAAGEAVGERTWRMPLPDDYVASLASDVADLNNAPPPGQAGAVVAALYLREFTGNRRDRWVHLDMSAPAWIETHDGPLVKGATGWGVRLLLRWLGSL